ncbi:MAG: tetratricopeptide repeat protein [Muribaculaceae bacterium]|nr:tetratricopeptide repeat protein [Muribaculaceae bacterium]
MHRRTLSSLTLLLISAVSVLAQINIERALTVGRNALFFDDYVLAIQYFNQVIALKPNMAEPYMLRAVAKYNLDDFHGAEADATEALTRNPFLPEAWEVRAVARQNMGNAKDAINDYRGALRQLPLNRHLLFNMALAQADAGLFEASDSTFAMLLKEYPGFDDALVGHAQLSIVRGDTLTATADLTRALEINPKSPQALTMRAMLALEQGSDLNQALTDIDDAIRLQPNRTGLRINRAVIRYKLDDLNGALEDFDFVVNADPLNAVAIYNRALLRAELNDNDRAVSDLNRVLQLRPGDHRALYNRAVLLAQKHDTEAALADIDALLNRFPDMESAYSLRSYVNHLAGNDRQARADARRAEQLASRPITSDTNDEKTSTPDDDAVSEGDVTARFSSLLTVNDASATEPEQHFASSSIKGRVQDQDVQLQIQPIYTFSYYVGGAYGDNGMLDSDVYMKEIADINDSRALHFVIHVTNSLPSFTRQEEIDRHFESIRHYGSVLASGHPRAIDYFGRAMDHITVHNYEQAISDLDHTIELTSDFAPAWFLRSVARYRMLEATRGQVTEITSDADEQRIADQNRMAINMMLSDLDRAIELSPRMAPAWYNRGTILLMLKDYESAIEAFTSAIDLAPDMGPAWFNRGYAHYSLGNAAAATADVSRAGQLGIHTGYSLLKRMKL